MIAALFLFVTFPLEFQWNASPPNMMLFKMEIGACLVGPMEFYDDKGTPGFTLKAGESYPPQCNKCDKISMR
jgi:hypothetical protein